MDIGVVYLTLQYYKTSTYTALILFPLGVSMKRIVGGDPTIIELARASQEV